MDKEKQVVSLELAKKMKDLGFKQVSLFWWGEECNINNFSPRICTDLSRWDKERMCAVCSAYTVAELGEMLPDSICKFCEDYYVNISTFEGLTTCSYIAQSLEDRISESAESEADARAKMLIYLKEHNLI